MSFQAAISAQRCDEEWYVIDLDRDTPAIVIPVTSRRRDARDIGCDVQDLQQEARYWFAKWAIGEYIENGPRHYIGDIEALLRFKRLIEPFLSRDTELAKIAKQIELAISATRMRNNPEQMIAVRRELSKQYYVKLVAIGNRDGFVCQECGANRRLSLDHIIPVSAGGTNDNDNLRILCLDCNSSKGATLPE